MDTYARSERGLLDLSPLLSWLFLLPLFLRIVVEAWGQRETEAEIEEGRGGIAGRE